MQTVWIAMTALVILYTSEAVSAQSSNKKCEYFNFRLINQHTHALHVQIQKECPRSDVSRPRTKRQIDSRPQPKPRPRPYCTHYEPADHFRNYRNAQSCAKQGARDCIQRKYCMCPPGLDRFFDNTTSTRNGWPCAQWSKVSIGRNVIQELQCSRVGRAGNYFERYVNNTNKCYTVGGDAPWCYTGRDREALAPAWEYCHKKCGSTDGYCFDGWLNCAHAKEPVCSSVSAYGGTHDHTKSGWRCAPWNAAYLTGRPDLARARAAFQRVPGKTVPAHNHCRNPTKAHGGPWCYVESKEGPKSEMCFRDCGKTSWAQLTEHVCVIEEECAMNTGKAGKACRGINGYGGYRQHTRNGHFCDMWTSHLNIRKSFPGKVLPTHNYCRNPDNGYGPWCYAAGEEAKWEYCFNTCDNTDLRTESCVNEYHQCYHAESATCRKLRGYGGRVNTTARGHACTVWSKYPLTDKMRRGFDNNVPETNYCRNPDNGYGPWCYASSAPGGWDYCFSQCNAGQRAYPTPNDIRTTKNKRGAHRQKRASQGDQKTTADSSAVPDVTLKRNVLIDTQPPNPQKTAPFLLPVGTTTIAGQQNPLHSGQAQEAMCADSCRGKYTVKVLDAQQIVAQSKEFSVHKDIGYWQIEIKTSKEDGTPVITGERRIIHPLASYHQSAVGV